MCNRSHEQVCDCPTDNHCRFLPENIDLTKDEISERLKPNRGGSRPNSGRKKGIETKTISFRVPADKIKEYKAAINNLLKSL